MLVRWEVLVGEEKPIQWFILKASETLVLRRKVLWYALILHRIRYRTVAIEVGTWLSLIRGLRIAKALLTSDVLYHGAITALILALSVSNVRGGKSSVVVRALLISG